MQRAVYLHSPGNIYISHHVCKHLKLKPNYKDVYLKRRKRYQLTDIENDIFEAEYARLTCSDQIEALRVNQVKTKLPADMDAKKPATSGSRDRELTEASSNDTAKTPDPEPEGERG